jgi:ribosomal-protein-alanine N-acetyltransferase
MIRPFYISDLDQILKIEYQSFPKSPYDLITFINLYSEYRDTFMVYTTKSEDKKEEILGYIVYSPDGHIISIAVHPNYRRKGIGTKLLKKVFSSPRINRVWAEVRRSNSIAQRFYLKLGFKITGIIPNYYGDEDAFIIEWLPEKNEK